MSYDICPQCSGPTEKFGQPCQECCQKLDDILRQNAETNSIVKSIMDDPKPKS